MTAFWSVLVFSLLVLLVFVIVTLMLWIDPYDDKDKDTITLVEVLRREFVFFQSVPPRLKRLSKRIY